MEEGLRHEKLSLLLQTEEEKNPSLRRAALSIHQDTNSLEYDTLPQKENAHSFQRGDEEDEDEDLHVYDSLDVSAQPGALRNPTLLHTEYLDTQTDEREETSQLLPDDAYSGLRYDPNWRTTLRGAAYFNQSPRSSVGEFYQDPNKKPSQCHGDGQRLVLRGGYRYIVDTSPAAMTSPRMAASESHQPYCLHPQDGQTSSPASRPPETGQSQPSCTVNKNFNKSLRKGFGKKTKNISDNARFHELTEDLHTMYIKDFQSYYLQEQQVQQIQQAQQIQQVQQAQQIQQVKQAQQVQQIQHVQKVQQVQQAQQIQQVQQVQQMSTSTCPKVLLNKKLDRPNEDIVERNKITLGRNATKGGSYVRVHAGKQDTPPSVHQVSQISGGRKAQKKETETRESGDSVISLPAAVPQTDYQKKPPLSSIHLNINLHPLAHLLPLFGQKSPDSIFSLSSLHGCPRWSPESQVDLVLSPECQPTNIKKSSKMFLEGAKRLHQRNLERSHRQRAIKWPLPCEREDQTLSQNLPRTPTTTLPLGSGSSTVLPPIKQSPTGKQPELISGVNTSCPVHRSSSDGYLVHMERQKQLKERVTYKESSLRDYKKLKTNLDLEGFGPDHTATENTVEKMKQKLCSNVIHKQKLNTSRIPFLLTKEPDGNDKKVPRMKALEYAKTIAKPAVQRQRHQSEGLSEPASYSGGSDVSELSSLEILRKRHEEEKHAVALLRKVRAV
ncbi:jhy protein homolog [Centropristis striata]|uniref:jhy protein homolog n=1 Tax=Centropristis striata TaxID=184440 RepID=UPI0027E08F6F|nr:jhy protein homolog [Centropristis striata]